MFNEILKRLRLEKHITQREIAQKLNISRVAYTNYELGNREPDFEMVKRIAAMFDVSIDYLFGNSPVRYTAQTFILKQTEIPESMENTEFVVSLLTKAGRLGNVSRTKLLDYANLLVMGESALEKDRS